MMRLVLMLIPSLALADIKLLNEGVDAGNVTTLNCVGENIDCARSGSIGVVTVGGAMASNLDLFVSPTGSDSNPCTSSGASACLTIQGAINKIPKALKYRAIVHVAAGSYAGFVVAGFNVDPGIQQVASGIMIDGARLTSTIASGSATGTATSATAGAQDVNGTLTKTAAGWTVDDLKNRFITITGGTGVGQVKMILSNSATVITLSGYFSPVPDGTSTYAIQDASAVISSCVTLPPSASATSLGTTAAARIQGNSAATTVTLRNLSVTAACTFGVISSDVGTLAANFIQFRSTSGTASRISASGSVYVDTVSSVYPSTTGTHVSMSNNTSVANTLVAGGIGSLSTSPAAGGTVQFCSFSGGLTGINIIGAKTGTILTNSILGVNTFGLLLSASLVGNFNNNMITCTSTSTGTGIYLQGGSIMSSSASHDHVATCGVAISVEGPSVMTATQLGVGPGTTGIVALFGGLFTHSGGAPGFTSISGNEAVLDSVTTGATSTWSGIGASPSCFTSLGYRSAICQD